MLSSLTGIFSRGGAETAPPRDRDFSHEELMKPWESQEARDAYPLGLLAACVARTAELGFEGMQDREDRPAALREAPSGKVRADQGRRGSSVQVGTVHGEHGPGS